MKKYKRMFTLIIILITYPSQSLENKKYKRATYTVEQNVELCGFRTTPISSNLYDPCYLQVYSKKLKKVLWQHSKTGKTLPFNTQFDVIIGDKLIVNN